jgi:hypothetical protein
MKNNNNKNCYDDIINIEYHGSTTHPKMSAINRAAQFAPFAALTGYDSSVKEEARLTDTKIELDEYMIALLDDKIRIIQELLPDCPEVEITYFIPDENKGGGKYVSIAGNVLKIDTYEHNITMEKQLIIPIEDIIDIKCDMIDKELMFD